MIRLAAPVQDALLLARHVVGHVQRTSEPVASPLLSTGLLDLARTTSLPQPDDSSCGSSAIVMVVSLHDAGLRTRVLDAADPASAFGDEALAVRRQTNGLLNRRRLQLPWPESLGTRPAALARYLGDLTGRLHTRVVDPRDPGRAWAALLDAGRPVVMYVGDGSWMQHIVLVATAGADRITVYEPAQGLVVARTREDFVTARLGLGGWDQPWLLML